MKEVTSVNFRVDIKYRRPGEPNSFFADKQSKYLQSKYTLEHMCLTAFKIEKDRL